MMIVAVLVVIIVVVDVNTSGPLPDNVKGQE